MKRILMRGRDWLLKKSTKVVSGRRVRSTKPYFETTMRAVAEVVGPIRKKHPFFKGVWIFGSVPDKVHNDPDVIIVMDEAGYNFHGNIRTHIAEQLKQKLGLKKVDWMTINTQCLEKDLTHIRRMMELWRPDIECFYGDPETKQRLGTALKSKVKGYYAQYDRRVLKDMKRSRKKEKGL
ncbi:MAG: hypothetical protein WC634_03600 [archaeon]